MKEMNRVPERERSPVECPLSGWSAPGLSRITTGGWEAEGFQERQERKEGAGGLSQPREGNLMVHNAGLGSPGHVRCLGLD